MKSHRARCVKLGIDLAQPPGYPQQGALAAFCPRYGDSSNRDSCTGLPRSQVGAVAGENTVVHTRRCPLLLRLCINRRYKKKTGDNIHPRRNRCAADEGKVGRPPLEWSLPGPSFVKDGGYPRGQPIRRAKKNRWRQRFGSDAGAKPQPESPYAGDCRRKASRRSTDRGRLKR